MLDLERLGETRPPTPYLPPKVSWEDYHDAWDNERPTEWVDGEIIDVSPENVRHHFSTTFVHDLVRHAAEQTEAGLVFSSNFIMRLPSRPSGRMPDIFFVRRERLHLLTNTYFDGPADLAVEIVSPQSNVRDRREKLAEYEAAGIPEFWVIDEPRKEALFYVLDADGTYQLTAPDADGIYTSTVLPNLRVRVRWLWQWPLPRLTEAQADLPA